MREKVIENGLATILVLAITVVMVFIFIRVGEGYQGLASEWSKIPGYPYQREGSERAIQEYQRYQKMRRDALIVYGKLVREYPESNWASYAQCRIGDMYRDLGEYGEALVEYQKVTDNYPQSRWAGIAQRAIGDLKDADYR